MRSCWRLKLRSAILVLELLVNVILDEYRNDHRYPALASHAASWIATVSVHALAASVRRYTGFAQSQHRFP